MKKVFYAFILIIISILFSGCTSSEVGNLKVDSEITYDYDSVQEEIIRFHVIANSDTDEDQELKLKVRDEVIKFLTPLLDESSGIEESREILKENDKKVIDIAKKVIKENGYNYSVKSELSRENFPEKIYGNIVLPQGEYEAYRILIGKSSGQNWWCVMFPPLCFVDVTKGEVAYNETERQMNKVVENKNNSVEKNDSKRGNSKEKDNKIDEEVNKIEDDTKIDEKEEYNVKFKIVEVIKELF
ncbi:stage II sporulation protein R [Clostridium sardiniense]|uniref:stage II sporulation protein R n=1 Tax=Clostridium sardiniense TaxID=29369 RepID=UPI003D339169